MVWVFIALPSWAQVKEGDNFLKGLVPVKSKEISATSQPVQVTEKKKDNRPDRLKLLNGDSFTGKFQGVNDGHVLWLHPSFAEPARVIARDVSSVRLEQREVSAEKTENCSVSLVSGGKLNGVLLELDEDGLTLDTWYGGKLKISREFVRSIEPGIKPERIVYQGPEDGPDGWMTGNRNTGQVLKQMLRKNAKAEVGAVGADKQRALAIIRRAIVPGKVVAGAAGQQGAWRYVNNGFVCASSGPILGRKDLELPGQCSLTFDLQWTGYFNLGVNIFADQINNEYSGNSYSLRVDQNNIYLYRIQNGSTANLGNVRSQLTGRKRCQLSLLIDKEAKTLSVLIDGQLIRKWEDTRPFAGKGKGLLFTSRNNSAMRLSRIRITEWNGSLPESDASKSGNGKEDFVVFSNKDSISGKAKRIEGDKLIFTTNFGDIPLPVSNMSSLTFSNPIKRLTPKERDVKMLMQKNGIVNVELLSWSAGKAKVRSPYFGEAVFDSSVFEKLDFNLNEPRQDDEEGLFGL
ncbi:MAG: hypothetical protein P8M70_04805 [Verrucomicrobiota bacterium]|nr:hypothetical protein [Verrucomicrobiota bacterium]